MSCAFIFWKFFVIIINLLRLEHSNAPYILGQLWLRFFNQLICLHDISIPEGWKVIEEESHSEECSMSIDEQVQDRTSVSRILGYCTCDRRFSYDTNITWNEEMK